MPATRTPRKPAAPRPAPQDVPAPAPKPVRAAKPAAAAKAPSPAQGAAAAAPPAPAAKPAKEPKTAKRAKPVRDSFTMPEADFALIGTLKARALAEGRVAKKSELLRAGLQALAALDATALLAALERLAPVKVGRPGKGR